jgi:hypothetical protein
LGPCITFITISPRLPIPSFAKSASSASGLRTNTLHLAHERAFNSIRLNQDESPPHVQLYHTPNTSVTQRCITALPVFQLLLIAPAPSTSRWRQVDLLCPHRYSSPPAPRPLIEGTASLLPCTQAWPTWPMQRPRGCPTMTCATSSWSFSFSLSLSLFAHCCDPN